MQLEIIENEKLGYTIVLEGMFFRYCKTYSELESTINSLVKSKYNKNLDGFI